MRYSARTSSGSFRPIRASAASNSASLAGGFMHANTSRASPFFSHQERMRFIASSTCWVGVVMADMLPSPASRL